MLEVYKAKKFDIKAHCAFTAGNPKGTPKRAGCVFILPMRDQCGGSVAGGDEFHPGHL